MKYLFLLLVLTGCGRKIIPIKETFHRSDTTIIHDRIVPVNVPGSNVVAVGSIDSLLNAWRNVKPAERKVVQVVDKTNQTRLTIYYDSLTRMVTAQCETLEKTYNARLQEKETIIHEQKETLFKEQKNFADRLKQIVTYVVVAIAAIILLIVTVAIFLYKRLPHP